MMNIIRIDPVIFYKLEPDSISNSCPECSNTFGHGWRCGSCGYDIWLKAEELRVEAQRSNGSPTC